MAERKAKKTEPTAENPDEVVEIVYLGPAHVLEHEGEPFEPGEAIKMTRRQARDLQGRGHTLGGMDPLPGGTAATTGGEGNRKQREALDEYFRAQAEANRIAAERSTAENAVAQAQEVREAQGNPA
jgi:hypothetical protein